MEKININGKIIGSDETPFIIAEIGANHNGDIHLAKKLIDAATDCGCDAVKFQSWTPESLIAKEEYERNQSYKDSIKKHFGSLKEMVEKYYLSSEDHYELKRYCDKANIIFCSTPFSKSEVDLLYDLGVPFFKIASMDANNTDLLRYVARKQRPTILSTGMATMSEIEAAVNVFECENNRNIILLHCIAIYPPNFRDINLNNISMLRQAFGYPVGFSDHSIGIGIPLASVALGSCVIEKHFTLDKDLPGWDHEVSAEPSEMKTIVEEAKKIHRAMGTFRRIVSEAEEEKKIKFRRSIVAARDLTCGHKIFIDDLVFKRPGTGIRPDEACYVVNRTLNRTIARDELIHWKYLD